MYVRVIYSFNGKKEAGRSMEKRSATRELSSMVVEKKCLTVKHRHDIISPSGTAPVNALYAALVP